MNAEREELKAMFMEMLLREFMTDEELSLEEMASMLESNKDEDNKYKFAHILLEKYMLAPEYSIKKNNTRKDLSEIKVYCSKCGTLSTNYKTEDDFINHKCSWLKQFFYQKEFSIGVAIILVSVFVSLAMNDITTFIATAIVWSSIFILQFFIDKFMHKSFK